MQEVRWLLVGAGDIAMRRVAPALVEVENSALAAVCDVREASARQLAERFQVKAVFTDYARALAAGGFDAVYIATPLERHVEMGLAALAAGKHFLCEKPLGRDGAECLVLLAASRKTDRLAACSNYRRLSEQYKATATMLSHQAIGNLAGGWAVYSTSHYNPGQSLADPVRELGFYIIDIAISFFGMPVGVMAQTGSFSPDRKHADMASIILRFPGGALFTITLDWRPHLPGTRHELELFGSRGRIHWPEWPPHGNGPIFKITKAGTEQIETHTNQNFHLPMIADFVAAIREQRPPVCTLENGVKTAVITEAVFRSAAGGRFEPITWQEQLP